MVGLLYATKGLVFGYGQLVAAGFIKRGLAEDSTPCGNCIPCTGKTCFEKPSCFGWRQRAGETGMAEVGNLAAYR